MGNHQRVMGLNTSLQSPVQEPLDTLFWRHKGLDTWNGCIQNYVDLQTLKDKVTISNRRLIRDWIMNDCCRKRQTRLLRAVALGKIAEGSPEGLVGTPGEAGVMAREQPSVAQPDQQRIEAACGWKYKISVSCECQVGPISGGKWCTGPVSVLCCTQLVYPQQILF